MAIAKLLDPVPAPEPNVELVLTLGEVRALRAVLSHIVWDDEDCPSSFLVHQIVRALHGLLGPQAVHPSDTKDIGRLRFGETLIPIAKPPMVDNPDLVPWAGWSGTETHSSWNRYRKDRSRNDEV